MATAENMENQIDSEMSFASALEDYLTPDMGDLEEGSIVKGEVVRVDDDTVLVDVNFKSEGQIPAEEFRDAQGNMTVKVGDRVDVYVVRKNEMDGTITLSFDKAKRMQLFDQLEDVLAEHIHDVQLAYLVGPADGDRLHAVIVQELGRPVRSVNRVTFRVEHPARIQQVDLALERSGGD